MLNPTLRALVLALLLMPAMAAGVAAAAHPADPAEAAPVEQADAAMAEAGAPASEAEWVADGDATQGDATHGDATHADAIHADAIHADATHGDATHGEGTGGWLVADPAGEGATGGLTPDDRDAIGRIAYAEAGNQGEIGLVAVIFTILNRAGSGLFQDSVQAVIDAPNQFEPATRAGGWRYLPRLDPGRAAHVEALLDQIERGALADPTGGALYFQNADVVAARAARGVGSAYLIDFGGTPPIAVIGDHSFYDAEAGINLAAARQRAAVAAYVPPDDSAYVPPDEAAYVPPDEAAYVPPDAPADESADASVAGWAAEPADTATGMAPALIAAGEAPASPATW
jgi:spore germination cell wall hydrolase CwlJ-like protein